MKKYNILLALIASLSLFFTACDKDDSGTDSTPPSPVTGITVTPDYGALNFSWVAPQDEDLLYVDITFTDSKGVDRSVKTSSFAQETTIDGFNDTNEYTFSVTAVDESGNSSDVQQVVGTPDTPPFLFVINTVDVEPTFGGVKFTWTNSTGKGVKVIVKYTDESGEEQTVSYKAEEETGEGSIAGLEAVATTFTVIVADALGNESEPKSFEATPFLEKKIGKENWQVIDLSTEEPGEGAPNGLATAAFDDNMGTFWHSSWATYGSPGYPHFFTVDMGQKVAISRFECFRRQGDSRGQTKIQFLVSEDGENWTDLGEYDNDGSSDEGQNYPMSTAPTARYFKYVALEGPNFFAFLAEINVYGDTVE